jgi:hypothetical protein
MNDENIGLRLHIGELLRRKLDDELVLEDDVRAAVMHCERSGRTIKDGSSGSLLGYAVIGHMTCWVEYTRDTEGGYRLLNAYGHRMAIDLEETWHGR